MIEGVARVVEPETNAKLAVSFPDFGITEESEYWIIELGEYYSYAVVTNSSGAHYSSSIEDRRWMRPPTRQF